MNCAVIYFVTILVIVVLFRAYMVSLEKRHLARTELIIARLSLTIDKVTSTAQHQDISTNAACIMIRTVFTAAVKRARAELHDS